MRIIFLSLAAIGAAAVASAALAQPAAVPDHRSGAHAPPLTVDTFRGHRGARRGAPLMVDTFRGQRDRRRHRDRSGDGPGAFPWLGWGGYGEPIEPYGDGYFAGGGEVHVEGGRPVYEYDRAYPYEWDSAAAPAWEPGTGWTVLVGAEAPRCRMERGVRVCRGRRSP